MTRTLHIFFFGLFEKKLLQNVTNEESFKGFKIIITKCFKTLLENFQSVASITKLERIYYQAWQVLQSVAFITKRERDVTRYYLKRKITKTLNYLHLSWIQSKNSINDLKISGQNYFF